MVRFMGTQELFDYVGSFEEDTSGAGCDAHPAGIVPNFLGSSNHESNHQRMKQLELWYMGYQQKRQDKTIVYKATSSFARGSGRFARMSIWVSPQSPCL